MRKCKILLFYVYSNSAWLSAAMKWKYEINRLAVMYSLFLSTCTFMVFVCVDIYILWDNEETSSKTKPASNLLLFLTQISSSYISLHTWHDHRGFIFLIFLCLDLDTWNWCFASLERTSRLSCSFCSKCSSSGVETLLKEQTPSKLVVQGAKQWVVGGTGVER